MDDLISRAAAIEAALDGADEWDGGCNPTREEYIREHMAKLPAVGAIPVDWLDDRANDITRAPLYRRYAQMLMDEWQQEQEAQDG